MFFFDENVFFLTKTFFLFDEKFTELVRRIYNFVRTYAAKYFYIFKVPLINLNSLNPIIFVNIFFKSNFESLAHGNLKKTSVDHSIGLVKNSSKSVEIILLKCVNPFLPIFSVIFSMKILFWESFFWRKVNSDVFTQNWWDELTILYFYSKLYAGL